MNKKIILLFTALLIILSGCAGSADNINTTIKPVEISENQLQQIYDCISEPGSLNFQSGDFSDISAITSNSDSIKFDAKDYEGNLNTYSYNAFKYNDNNLVLIYDEEDHGWVCGCIYYGTTVDSRKLKEAKTYDDVLNLDPTVNSDPFAFSIVSADTLISRHQYNPKFPLSDTERTLHFTDDGLYLIQYVDYIFETEPTDCKISYIEKIEDEVYNTVYDLLLNHKS